MRLRILGPLFALLAVLLTAAACPVAPGSSPLHSHSLTPPSTEISPVAQATIDIINNQRASVDCEPLETDGSMVAFADNQAKWMSNGGGLVHSQLGPPILAENILEGPDTPDEVVAAWLDSDVHKKNMLNCAYDSAGIATFGGYWVAVFGTKNAA